MIIKPKKNRQIRIFGSSITFGGILKKEEDKGKEVLSLEGQRKVLKGSGQKREVGPNSNYSINRQVTTRKEGITKNY